MTFPLRTYLNAGYPALMVYGAEDKRILSNIEDICKDIATEKKSVFDFRFWTVANGWQQSGKVNLNQEGASTINDIKEALKQMLSFRNSGCYCLINFHFFIKDPGIIQLIKEIVYKWKNAEEEVSKKHLIFVENVLTIPPELEKEITVLDYELPTIVTLEDALNSVIYEPAPPAGTGKIRIKNLSAVQKDKVLSAALGMTYLEAENAFAISLIEKSVIDVDVINREKGQILKKGGLLEFFPAIETLDNDVGGVDDLKNWLRKRGKAFSPEAIKFGLPSPRGILLVGLPGSGKCVDGASFLWYNGGMKRIRQLLNSETQINNGEQTFPIDVPIISFDAKNSRFVGQRATTLIKNPETDGFCLDLKYGYQIKTSPWHPIWCSVDNKLGYYKIEDMLDKNNVWVPIKVGHTMWENNKYIRVKVSWELYQHDNTKTIKNKRKIKYTKNIEINNDVGYLFGVLLGDGSLSQIKNKTQHTFSFTTADNYILDTITNILKNNFSDSNICKGGGNKYKYNISCPELASLIRLLGANCRAENKGIPDFIFESPKSVIISVIQGLLDTDGYSNKKTGYIQYCSASEELARDVHNILLAFGIFSRLHFRNNKYLGAWYIDIYGENALKFYNTIGFKLTRKQEHKNRLSKTFNTNLQLYPQGLNVIMKKIFLERESCGVTLNKYTTNDGTSTIKASVKWGRYYTNTKHHRTPSTTKLREFIKDMRATDNEEIQQYYGYGEIVWLPLEKLMPCKVDLYDLSVLETHSFVANGIINHNSLVCKAVAQTWKLPLIRVDIGKAFGSLVGESESKIRMMTKQLEAMSPCVAWLDEIEKAFAGTNSSGITDSGVTMRVLGTFLTWKAECRKPVFLIATANNVFQLPPELLRKGRFDELFYIDLPSIKERGEIFTIHLKKRGRKPEKFDIDKLVTHSNNLVGSEIEEAIISGMYDAFDEDREVTTEDILHSMENSVPLIDTMAEQVQKTRAWAQGKARPASSGDGNTKTSSRRVDLGSNVVRKGINFTNN